MKTNKEVQVQCEERRDSELICRLVRVVGVVGVETRDL